MKQYLSEVFEVTDLGEDAHFLGNIVVRKPGSVRVPNPLKVKELLPDYGIENPKRAHWDTHAQKVEEAFRDHNGQDVYKQLKILGADQEVPITTLKDSDGKRGREGEI